MTFLFKVEHHTVMKKFNSVKSATELAKEINDQSGVKVEVSNTLGDPLFTITESGVVLTY